MTESRLPTDKLRLEALREKFSIRLPAPPPIACPKCGTKADDCAQDDCPMAAKDTK